MVGGRDWRSGRVVEQRCRDAEVGSESSAREPFGWLVFFRFRRGRWLARDAPWAACARETGPVTGGDEDGRGSCRSEEISVWSSERSRGRFSPEKKGKPKTERDLDGGDTVIHVQPVINSAVVRFLL